MQPRNSSAKMGLTLDDMRMSIGCISGMQLLSMEGPDRMSNRVAGAQRMVENVVEYKRRSGELTRTRSLAHRLPPEVQEIEQLASPQAYHVDEGPRQLESGNVTIKSHSESVCEPSVCGRVNIASIRSETQQVRSPHRASFKVARSGPLQCLKNCSCRCHYRSVIRSPRYFSNYLGDFFFRVSNVPWCFSPLVQCNEQSCRRSIGSSAELRYFLPSWLSGSIASFNVNFILRMLPLNICLQTRQTIPYDSPILVCVQERDTEGIRSLLRSGRASLNDVDPYGLGLLYVSNTDCDWNIW